LQQLKIRVSSDLSLGSSHLIVSGDSIFLWWRAAIQRYAFYLYMITIVNRVIVVSACTLWKIMLQYHFYN
jgi:hypothetical protein